MIANFEVKIIRLITGEDIIGFVYEDIPNNKVYIKFPKVFYFNYDTDTQDEELILVDWMTQKAFYIQETILSPNNILFTSHCNVEFGFEYLELIKETMILPKDVTDKIDQTMEELTPPEGAIIH